MSDIVVGGQLTLDLYPALENVSLAALLTPGQAFEIGAMTFSTGGAVSNTGLALYRLGADVKLVALVGDDVIGRVILAFLQEHDPALTEYIRVQPGESSAYTVILSPERVDRIMLQFPGTNRGFDITSIDFAAVQAARIFHLGYPTLLPRLLADDGEQLERIFRSAKLQGVVTSLDSALPDPAALRAYPNNPAARKAMRPQAKCRNAR